VAAVTEYQRVSGTTLSIERCIIYNAVQTSAI